MGKKIRERGKRRERRKVWKFRDLERRDRRKIRTVEKSSSCED